MSKLNSILIKAKGDLPPWVTIPEKEWMNIVNQLSLDEIAEIHNRIASLNDELKHTPDWDGDTQDDIHKTIHFFNELIRLFENKSKNS